VTVTTQFVADLPPRRRLPDSNDRLLRGIVVGSLTKVLDERTNVAVTV
jgi:hypothetical protein